MLSLFNSPALAHPNKLAVKAQYRADPTYWQHRPLPADALKYAVSDGECSAWVWARFALGGSGLGGLAWSYSCLEGAVFELQRERCLK